MKRTLCLLLCLILLSGLFTLCASADSSLPAASDKTEAEELRSFHSLEELNREDVNLGVITGMSTDMMTTDVLPKANIKYFNSMADVLYALSIGQIDGYLDDTPICKYLVAHNDGITCIEEPIGEIMDTAFILGKTDFDRIIQTELNEFILGLKERGEIEEILEIWYGSDEEKQKISIPSEGENGIIKAAICTQAAPACMIVNNELGGSEIDILTRFCREYGYGVEFTDMDFGGIINSVNSGRFNVGCSYISITEERKGSVNFSEPYMSSACTMIIRAPKQAEADFWTRLSASFERTFITESRWKLIAEGVKTTMIISICAAAIGTVLGFFLCLLRRMKNPILHAFTTAYIRILQGTPLLVVLMILYYIVFAKSGMSGELVAILAFALNFSAYVGEMFRTGIESVDRGQTEAAYAIGFTKMQTFFRIVIPQAALNFLPVYKGEFISLVKSTSVVGYIAVQDLTKMSDVIRSRTYEAFFPLIATAIIYFLLASLLTGLLRAVEIKVEPDRKNRKVKGVKMI